MKRTTIFPLCLLLLALVSLAGCAASEPSGPKTLNSWMAELDGNSDLGSRPAAQLVAEGDALMNAGKAQDALSRYEAAMANNTSDIPMTELGMRRAKSLEKLGLDEQALSQYLGVVAMDGNHAAARQGAGLGYLRSGHSRQARLHLEKAVELDSALWKSHNALGVIANHGNDAELAMMHFTTALSLVPDSSAQMDVQNNMGVTHLLNKDYNKAARTFAQALRLGQDLPDAHRVANNLGVSLVHLGRYQQALEAFRIDGDYARAHNNLGSVLMQTGNYPLAVEHFRKAFETSPTFYARANENLRRARLAMQSDDTLGQTNEQYASANWMLFAKEVLERRHQAQKAQRAARKKAEALKLQAEARQPEQKVEAEENGEKQKAARIERVEPELEAAEKAAPMSEPVAAKARENAEHPATAQPVSQPSELVEEGVTPEENSAVDVQVAKTASGEAEVTAEREIPVAGTEQWAVHLSSWRTLERAMGQLKSLPAGNTERFVNRVVIEGKGVWYRTVAGRFASRDEAKSNVEAVCNELGVKRKGVIQLVLPVNMAEK